MKWEQIGGTWGRIKDSAEAAWDRVACVLGRTAAAKGEELARIFHPPFGSPLVYFK
jgi:hypothetical protein